MGRARRETGPVKRRFAPFDRVSRGVLAAALLGLAVTTGCRDAAGPTTGAARVTVTTTGIDLDADGYIVTVDGEPGRAVAPVDAITLREIPTGAHTVALGGVAVNCVIGGENPRTVSVAAGSTAEIAFAVACVPDVGSVHVTTATTGVDLDPDGYAVSVDGGAEQAVGGSAALTLSDLRSGEHLVRLDGLAPNCAVSDASPRPVTVAFGATAEVAFAVACVADVGSLRVTTASTGLDLDGDGYTVRVDDAPGQAVGVNGLIIVSDLPSGEHVVRLDGMAANCVIGEPSPKTVPVVFGTTADVTFTVTCFALRGDLRVTTTTTGVDVDPGGYLVIVDGGPGQVVGVNGAVTITGLTAGGHTVALEDVASNCTVDGANPRTVTMRPDAIVELPFAVTCVATTGSLQVTATTTGADPDPSGYVVVLDSCLSFSCDRENGGYELIRTALGANDTALVAALVPGDYSIALDGVAANCAVRRSPETVTITAGSTALAAFTIECSPTTGSMRVTTATTGADLDPDGYTVTVDAGPDWPVPVNGATIVANLPAGDHTVALGGVASNCVVVGTNPRTASVAAGATAEVTFAVTCTALPSPGGNLRVTTATTGADLDPDGYTVLVQGLCHFQSDGDGGFGYVCEYERTESVGVNASVLIADVPVGAGVSLQDVAPNCTVVGENPRPAAIVSGSVSLVDFTVSCVAALVGTIAFSSERSGNFEIYVTNTDGSGVMKLTDHWARDVGPAWSPDGAKIAFSKEVGLSDFDHWEIYVMNADGSGVTRLSDGEHYDAGPLSWSPDGTRLAFSSDGDGSNLDIYVMNADGSGVTRLTDHAAADVEPTWSPDGAKVAFRSNRDGNFDLFVMHADGTGVTRLTDTPGIEFSPVWSPDGTKIAFELNGDIYVMKADGSGVTRLTDTPGFDGRPAWSPDGARIAFHSDRDGNFEIYFMNVDGSAVTRVTNDPARDWTPAWGPRGSP